MTDKQTLAQSLRRYGSDFISHAASRGIEDIEAAGELMLEAARVLAEHDWQAQAVHSAQGWMDRALKAEKQFERARRWAIAAGAPPEKMEPAPEAPQPAKPAEQEPVAWMCSNTELMHKGYQMFSATGGGDWNIPVYTAPQPAKQPLIADEICDSWEFITGHQIQCGPSSEGRPMYWSTDEVIEFARALERVYGIGEHE